MNIKLDITPDPAIDLTRLGVCDKFDTKLHPGFVVCYFRDGQELKLTLKKFDECRFMIAEEADANGKPLLTANLKRGLVNEKHLVKTKDDYPVMIR